MKFNPHAYQERAIRFVMAHPACALFMDMGLGKSAVTLTAIDDLIGALEVGKVLVIAPKSVALNTWSGECEKWDHLRHLRISIVMGTPAQRKKALGADADIYVTNRDNVVWLVGEYVNTRTGRQLREWDFDTVVLDESSSFKNWQAKRYRALARVRPFIRRIIELTGTPAPNGLMDLWAQVRLLDGGERLGRFITQYREKYFHPGAHNGSVVYEYLPNKGAKETIARKISDICLSMQASDYLEMPAVMDGGMQLRMDGMDGYRKFEKDNILALPDGSELEAVTAVALTNKLLQYSSGAVYDSDHEWHRVDDTKLDAFCDLVEQTDEPVLVYYNYKHERERILERHPEAVSFHGEPDILKDWNAGRIRLLLCHPASVAYGLNMQQGGHIIVWYSPTWNLELYQQANARLNRQGQLKPIILYHLVCKDTMDEAVMQALRSKDSTQSVLMRYINSKRSTN